VRRRRTRVAYAQALEAQGFWVSAIRPPTVPEGKARLRFTLSGLHAPADIDALLDALPGRASRGPRIRHRRDRAADRNA
jgi:8-amino-7-oxononanoate synthase